MASSGDSLYTVRTPDGLELGPVRPETIVDLILSKKVFGNETVSADGRNWTPIRDVAIFKKALEQRESGVTSINELDLEDEEEEQAQEEILDIEVDESVDLTDPGISQTGGKKSAAERIEIDAIDDALEGTIPPPPPSAQEEPIEAEPLDLEPVEEVVAAEIVEEVEEIEEIETLEPVEEVDDEPLGAGPATLEAELDDLPPAAPPKAAPKKPAPAPAAEPVLELEILEETGQSDNAQAILNELKNPENRYTIRDPDGLVLGPIRIATLRDLIEAGKITKADHIQKNEQDWAPITALPELVYLMEKHRPA